MQRTEIVKCIKAQVPKLLAIYAFGSRVQGEAGAASDLDLAVLVAGYADAVQLWEVSGKLAELAGCEVDLLDMRAASTVMQCQVLTKGERLWAADHQAAIYEAAILTDKLELDSRRAGVLADIGERGSVYDR
ncbi:MAG: type VII toxin-antitoxin system MntA family adenylyltransferase antitoxin [Pseudohongiellaceae bacterium]